MPEQNSGTATNYAYNADDTIYSVTDARGASAAYSYNNRHQVTSVSHTLSGYSSINVNYGYDAAGNRTSMSHSVGGVAKDSATYNYDSLSRMTSETRFINALTGSSTGGNYTINYGYTVSGELQSVSDPFNSTTNLSYDAVGRTASVTGSYGGTNYTYASSVGYRAWGAVKSATFGDNSSETISYNARLQPTQFRLPGGTGVNQMRYDYSYFDDGRLKEFKDLDDQVGDPHTVTFHYMSRAYTYDQSARASSVGQPANYNVIPPFSGNYSYDAFNNMTSRSGQYALNTNESDSATYTNNRRVQSGWSYDADGRILTSADNSDSGGSSTRTWSYDAAGELIIVSETRNGQTTTSNLAYDGDGELLYESVSPSTSDYLIRSTVLEAVLTKLTATGGKDITYVPANGLVAPMQNQNSPYTPFMSWVKRDALGIQESQSNGYNSFSAYDPLGNLIPNVQPPYVGTPPYVPVYGATWGGASWNSFVNANNLAAGCNYLGAPMDCNRAMINKMGLGFASNLPGSYLDNAYAEQLYAGDVRDASRPKPKAPPTLKPGRKRSHAEIARRRNESAWVGDDEGDPQNSLVDDPPQKRSDTSGDKDIRVPAVSETTEEISPCVQKVLGQFFDSSVLNGVRIHPDGLPVYVPASGTGAFTGSGRDIYFPQGEYNAHTIVGIAGIAHEVEHIKQWRKYGSSFGVLYLADSAGISYQIGTHWAYWANRFEIQARKKEREVTSALIKTYGGKDPCPK